MSAFVIVLASCGEKDKKTELADLKKQEAEITGKIAKLEAELSKQGGDSSKVKVKDVELFTIKEGVFKNYVEVQGKVDAEENVQVNPEAMGVITALYVKAGDRVSKGQVVAQIDDKVMRQNLAELQTRLDLANTLYQRQKNLWDQKIGTEVQFINAKNQKESAERAISTLKQQLNNYKVKSPISGTVDEMEWRLGQAIQAGATGLRVVNGDKLKIKADMAETYSSRVNQGDEVEVLLPDAPDSLNTKVSFASKIIDPASRSFRVEVKLPAKKIYRPNMLAILKVTDYRNNKAITVPVKAIQKGVDAEYVFIAENNKAKRVNIKKGNTSNGMTEITSGLKNGDQVITLGYNDLNEGDPINASK